MSTMPRAVQEAEELANRLQEELNKPASPEENGQDGQPQPTEPQPQPTDDGSTPPAPAPAAPADDMEHRYKVLQGKYNSEVPRLSSENKELRNRLQALEEQLQTLREAKPAEPLVKPEEIEEYGEGLIDVARRIAREELMKKEAEINLLRKEIDSIKSVTTKTVESDFFKSLTGLVPDWEAMNTDPNFLVWLEEVDELTGEQRQNLLTRAEQARDAVRAAKFFQAYKKTSSTWAANSQNALASQVVPPSSPAPNTPPAKKVWSRGEIGAFYDRMRRGLVSEQEAVAIEADIMSAQVEGRIR